jgi:hypothetical protein
MKNFEHFNQIRRKIQGWLLQDGCSIEEKPEAGLAWFLLALRNAIQYGISQRIDRPDEIYIRVTIELDKSAVESIASLEVEKRRILHRQLCFHLLSINVEFQIEGAPVFEKITIAQRIFDDALTKDEFFDRLFRVQRAVLGCGWLLSESVEMVNGLPEQYKVC